MKILLLCHSFNCLTQGLFCALEQEGHTLSVLFDVHHHSTQQSIEKFQPDLVIASFLKRKLPTSIWSNWQCMIVHPGIVGDRGPSSLDWAILRQDSVWGVTIIKANDILDGGDVWASEAFVLPQNKSKSHIYRHLVTPAAIQAVSKAIRKFQNHELPTPQIGTYYPKMSQADRQIVWDSDSSQTILRKMNASDSEPGVLDSCLGMPCYLFNGHIETMLSGPPGKIIAVQNQAICRATVDGAVWVTHLKSTHPNAIKLPAAQVLGPLLNSVPQVRSTWQDIYFERKNEIGLLYFDFYNGAMSTVLCKRLKTAFESATQEPISTLVLMGGDSFWSNGIDLNTIEAHPNPGEASLENVRALNALVRSIITCDKLLTVSYLRGNAGAGGVSLALAADLVVADAHVILNPHYQSMGNLYGSEYWTYLFPNRIEIENTQHLMKRKLPINVKAALSMGLINNMFEKNSDLKFELLFIYLNQWFKMNSIENYLQQKQQKRILDERCWPLSDYEKDELTHMKDNFFGTDPSYHIARQRFVYHTPHHYTPQYLASYEQKL